MVGELLPVARGRRELAWWDRAQPPKYLQRHEVHRVLDATRTPRDRLLVNLLWCSGPRIGEALLVRPCDFDQTAEAVRLKTFKTRRRKGSGNLIPERIVPCKPSAIAAAMAHAYHGSIPPESALFGIKRSRAHEVIRKAMLAAGIDRERAHPHTLRHSFAVNCLMNGVPLIVVQRWLGHASIFSTLVYLKVAEPDAAPLYDRVEF